MKPAVVRLFQRNQAKAVRLLSEEIIFNEWSAGFKSFNKTDHAGYQLSVGPKFAKLFP